MGDGCRLFVYGISTELSNEEIQVEFEKFGNVTDTYNTGKGYAFVTFADQAGANAANQDLNGSTIFGQQIKVDFAKSRDGGGGGGAIGGGVMSSGRVIDDDGAIGGGGTIGGGTNLATAAQSAEPLPPHWHHFRMPLAQRHHWQQRDRWRRHDRRRSDEAC